LSNSYPRVPPHGRKNIKAQIEGEVGTPFREGRKTKKVRERRQAPRKSKGKNGTGRRGARPSKQQGPKKVLTKGKKKARGFITRGGGTRGEHPDDAILV